MSIEVGGDRSAPELRTIDDIKAELEKFEAKGECYLNQAWREAIAEAEKTYVRNPPQVDAVVSCMRVRMLSGKLKCKRLAEKAASLIKDEVTAIPTLVLAI